MKELYSFQYGFGNVIPDNGGQYPIYGSNGIIGYYDQYNSEDSPVIGHIGANAGVVVFGKGKHYVTYNGVICKVKADVYQKYAYYVLLNSNPKRLTRGSTQPFISYDLLEEIPVFIHDKDKQYLVGDLLSVLDEKIALNNEINSELENTAKDLYNYWFVQFDFPDEKGRPYKSSGGKMVYNSLLKREIPEGWKVENFNKYATIGSGFPFSSKKYSSNGNWRIVTIKNVQDGYLDLSTIETINNIPANIPEFVKLKIGDVLISLTGNVGRMCFVDSYNLLLNQRVGKLLTSKVFLNFAYLILSSQEQQIRLGRISNGSSQKNLSPIQAADFNFTNPSIEILNLFNSKINGIYEQVIKNKQENIELIQLRDFLLPMLMNGQVSVSD